MAMKYWKKLYSITLCLSIISVLPYLLYLRTDGRANLAKTNSKTLLALWPPAIATNNISSIFAPAAKIRETDAKCSNLKPITSIEDMRKLPESDERQKLNQVDSNGVRLEQDEPRILKYIKDNCDVLLRPPDGRPTTYKFKNASMGQDEIVRRIFRNMTGGFFIEFGAYDGVISSNTLDLERDYGWKGLLIEASVNEVFKLHQNHRNAWISHACVSVHPYPHQVIFHENPGGLGKIATVLENQDNAIQDTKNGNVSQQCFPLFSFIAALDLKVVDFLSVDVEGYELQILKTIPFHKVLIKVLAVEIVNDRHGSWRYRKFMKTKGFRTLGIFYDARKPFDLIFVHKSVEVDDSVKQLYSNPRLLADIFTRMIV